MAASLAPATAPAPAITTVAGARDATRLELLVCLFLFFWFLLFFITLIFIIGPLNALKWRWQQQQHHQ